MNTMREYFNDRADSWDKLTGADDNIKLLLRLCEIKRSASILDVGCGTGALERCLLDYDPAKIWAVDFADKMIATAKRNIKNPRIEFLCADIFQINGILCDYCFFLNAFPHFSDPKQLVAHVTRLVRAGGRIVISHAPGSVRGVRSASGFASDMLPAQGLVNLLQPFYALDIIVCTDKLLIVSGVKMTQ